jgi:hypothetical protein
MIGVKCRPFALAGRPPGERGPIAIDNATGTPALPWLTDRGESAERVESNGLLQVLRIRDHEDTWAIITDQNEARFEDFLAPIWF